MYPECFEEKDKHFLNFEYKIRVDSNVEPKVHPPRCVPFELKPKLEVKLLKMEHLSLFNLLNPPGNHLWLPHHRVYSIIF